MDLCLVVDLIVMFIWRLWVCVYGCFPFISQFCSLLSTCYRKQTSTTLNRARSCFEGRGDCLLGRPSLSLSAKRTHVAVKPFNRGRVSFHSSYHILQLPLCTLKRLQGNGHKFRATEFCALAPKICGSSVCNVLHITLLAPRILRWLQDILKICSHLIWLTK
jgi:hypothetical protein